MNRPTALIADDVSEMRLLLQRALETLGIDVIAHAANGDQAMQVISTQMPNICFLDIDMPDKTGLEILQEISNLSIKTYPVIVSGHSDVDSVKAALAQGAKGFVVKPYSFNKIKQITDRYFSTTRRLQDF